MNAVLESIRELSRPAEAASELHELSMRLAAFTTIPPEIQEPVREVTDAVDFGTRTLPALNTFLTDVGAGLDFSIVGIYVAKAVSTAGEPPNVFIRIRHRF